MATTRPLRLGFLTPFDGPAGLWTPSSLACCSLAVAELNAQGGILGRPVALRVADIGASPEAAEAAAAALLAEGVEAVVAMAPSYTRPAVSRALGDRAPFIFTPPHEGPTPDTDAIATGETSRDLLAPAIHWLTDARKAERFFLIGNDYNWPRASFAVARRLIGDVGARVVGERLLPFGNKDYGPVLAEIAAAAPDVLVMYTVGQETVDLNRAIVDAGMAGAFLRFSSAADETVICAVGPDYTENLYISAGYLMNARDRANQCFLERYHDAYGACPPPPNAFGQSAYEGVHALAGLARAAGGLAPTLMRGRVGRAAKTRSARMTPEGLVGARPVVHLAQVLGIETRIFASF
jgi:ABC-type branched-subunit amino acid transport system substrate-binding protein